MLYLGQIKIDGMSVLKEIKLKITSKDKGQLLFISDFADIGDYDTVRKSLQRLTGKNLIIRLSKGIYYYPKTDNTLGVIYPSAEQIGKAIAKRDKARIIPTGSYALYMLGLSNQVPMNIVYLTDGSARKIRINNQTILFKKTSPKNLSSKHPLSILIIQGLKEKGKDHITKNDLKKIKDIIIKSGEIEKIRTDMRNAPVWIQKINAHILASIENEKLA